MQNYEVRYTAYKGQGSEVLSEGTMVVPSTNGRYGAENAIKGMFNDGQNRVIIHAASPINR